MIDDELRDIVNDSDEGAALPASSCRAGKYADLCLAAALRFLVIAPGSYAMSPKAKAKPDSWAIEKDVLKPSWPGQVVAFD